MTADVDIMPHILTFLVVSQQIGPASQNFFSFWQGCQNRTDDCFWQDHLTV